MLIWDGCISNLGAILSSSAVITPRGDAGEDVDCVWYG